MAKDQGIHQERHSDGLNGDHHAGKNGEFAIRGGPGRQSGLCRRFACEAASLFCLEVYGKAGRKVLNTWLMSHRRVNRRAGGKLRGTSPRMARTLS